MAETSATIKTVSPGGFCVELTLSDSETKSLMIRLAGALDWLTKHGYTPAGHNHQAASNGNGNGKAEEPAPVCAIHKTPMSKRESKGGGHFWSCSHKLDDGSWCPYKPPKQ